MLLGDRGLEIPNREEVLHSLKTIGYYRLSAYRHEKIGGRGVFKSIKTFDHLLEVYNFDRELRLLSLDAIERIEVAFRTVLSDTMCLQYGPFWFTNGECFKYRYFHANAIEVIEKQIACERKSNPFIRHYFANYSSPAFPPSWMLTEIMSFGFWSRVYSRLLVNDQKSIAKHFGFPRKILRSWMRTLTYLRNLCAHHSRVFDRTFVIDKPIIPRKYAAFSIPVDKFSARAFVMFRLLHVLGSGLDWLQKLELLVKKYNISEVGTMGLTQECWDMWRCEYHSADQDSQRARPISQSEGA